MDRDRFVEPHVAILCDILNRNRNSETVEVGRLGWAVLYHGSGMASLAGHYLFFKLCMRLSLYIYIKLSFSLPYFFYF